MSSAWGVSWGSSWGNSWGVTSPVPPTPSKPAGSGPGWMMFPPRKKGKKYVLKIYGAQFEFEELPDEVLVEHKEDIVRLVAAKKQRPVVRIVEDERIVDIPRSVIHAIEQKVLRIYMDSIRRLDDEDAIMVLL